MATCAECKHYEAGAEAGKGTCFGHDVSGNQDAAACPAGAFTPREE